MSFSHRAEEALQQELQFAATVCREFAMTRQTCGKLAVNFFSLHGKFTTQLPRPLPRVCRDYYRNYCRDYCRKFAAKFTSYFVATFSVQLPRLLPRPLPRL
jgi:hypothetical protein